MMRITQVSTRPRPDRSGHVVQYAVLSCGHTRNLRRGPQEHPAVQELVGVDIPCWCEHQEMKACDDMTKANAPAPTAGVVRKIADDIIEDLRRRTDVVTGLASPAGADFVYVEEGLSAALADAGVVGWSHYMEASAVVYKWLSDEHGIAAPRWFKESGEACPGCGALPGEGLTESCTSPDGCGFYRAMGGAL